VPNLKGTNSAFCLLKGKTEQSNGGAAKPVYTTRYFAATVATMAPVLWPNCTQCRDMPNTPSADPPYAGGGPGEEKVHIPYFRADTAKQYCAAQAYAHRSLPYISGVFM
jgi:hypothetical protein